MVYELTASDWVRGPRVRQRESDLVEARQQEATRFAATVVCDGGWSQGRN